VLMLAAKAGLLRTVERLVRCNEQVFIPSTQYTRYSSLREVHVAARS
jgi:hypothetical protein